jgi:hypothetical protein
MVARVLHAGGFDGAMLLRIPAAVKVDMRSSAVLLQPAFSVHFPTSGDAEIIGGLV